MSNRTDILKYHSALKDFLSSCQEELTPVTSSRVAKAREKLGKLTKVQFCDLSTDVYDELQRRMIDIPDKPKYLLPDQGYHPKRNQARQKLAALPSARFKDLVNDVLFEIEKREDINENNNKNYEYDYEKEHELKHGYESNQLPNLQKKLSLNIPEASQIVDDDLKTPLNRDFPDLGTNEETPSQREIKATTVVPQMAELTWSSDEGENENENLDNPDHVHNGTPVTSDRFFDNNSVSPLKFNLNSVESPKPNGSLSFGGKNILHKDLPVPPIEFESDSFEIPADKTKELQTEVGVIKKQISLLEAENTILKEKELKLQLLSESMKELEIENEELKNALDNFKAMSESVQDLKLKKEEELKDQQSQLNILSDSHTQLQLENEAMKQKADEYDYLIQSIDTLERENQELSKLSEQKDQRVLDLEESLKNLPVTKDLNPNNNEELENLKNQLKEMSQENETFKLQFEGKKILEKSHQDLLNKHEKLIKDHYDLQNSQQSTFNPKPVDNLSLSSGGSILEWQSRYEKSRSNQVLKDLTKVERKLDPRLFDSTGVISVEAIAEFYASVETMLIYLSEDDNEIESSILFERAANVVKLANDISHQCAVTDEKNAKTLSEKKRILLSSISNILSTTRHYALHNQILPKLVIDTAVNDVCFAVCNLAGLVKIKGNYSQLNQYSSTSAPLPLHNPKNLTINTNRNVDYKVNLTPVTTVSASSFESSQQDLDESIRTPRLDDSVSKVRPLKISQRLASGETRSNSFSEGLDKPLPPLFSPRTASPMSKKNPHNTSQSSISKSVDTTLTTPSKEIYKVANVSVSSLASKFSSPSNDGSANVVSPERNAPVIEAGMAPSPSKSKNILDRLKQFEGPSNNVKDLNGSPTKSKASSPVKTDNGVSRAFDKFGAKRRETPERMNGNNDYESPDKRKVDSTITVDDDEYDDAFESPEKLASVADKTEYNAANGINTNDDFNGISSNDYAIVNGINNSEDAIFDDNDHGIVNEINDSDDAIVNGNDGDVVNGKNNNDDGIVKVINNNGDGIVNMVDSNDDAVLNVINNNDDAIVNDDLGLKLKPLKSPSKTPFKNITNLDSSAKNKAIVEIESKETETANAGFAAGIAGVGTLGAGWSKKNNINSDGSIKEKDIKNPFIDKPGEAFKTSRLFKDGHIGSDFQNEAQNIGGNFKNPLAFDSQDELKNDITKIQSNGEENKSVDTFNNNRSFDSEAGDVISRVESRFKQAVEQKASDTPPILQNTAFESFDGKKVDEDFNEYKSDQPTSRDTGTRDLNKSVENPGPEQVEEDFNDYVDNDSKNESPRKNLAGAVRTALTHLVENSDDGKYHEYEFISPITDTFPIVESKNVSVAVAADDANLSAGSVLDIDPAMKERVVRRNSYREESKSKGNSNNRVSKTPDFEPVEEVKYATKEDKDLDVQHNYDDEEDGEDEIEDEEEFDFENFNTLNPDNTLRELLLYLEHQTVEVIAAIQKTLQSIRDPKATKGLLRGGAEEINSVVQQMTEGTSTLMNQSRYAESMGHARYVVGVLEDCVIRMESLYGEDKSKDGEYAGKMFKQRSAGIAFDVARSTKELVKTVEEASLRDEIAVLDSRLKGANTHQ